MSTADADADSLSPREGSPSSNPLTINSEGDSEGYQDSGVVLNSDSYRCSAANPSHSATGIGQSTNQHPIFSFRARAAMSTGSTGSQTSNLPMNDLRRPSIVDMLHTGGLVRNQRGSYEINLNNVLAQDVEMMYAYHHGASQRRDSKQVSDIGDASWMHSSVGSSSQHLATTHPSKFSCPSLARSWWNPKFESAVLEKHLGKTVIEFLRRRFRIALMFIGLFSLLWIVFFSVNIPFDPQLPANSKEAETRSNFLAIYSVEYSVWYVVGGIILFVCVGILLVITFTKIYAKFALPLSILLAVMLMLCSCALAMALYFDSDVQGFLTMSFVAQFTITAIVILIVFTLSRMPILLSLILCIIYLTVLELLVGFLSYGAHEQTYPKKVYVHSLISRILFYICLVLTGLSTAYLSQVRQHATFWKIAQCVLTQKAIELERDLEEQTILSMMPKPFADELMNLQVQLAFMIKQKLGLEEEASLDPMFQTISTPFTICKMDEVSILFADIVDFTEFSSNLTAAELVGILNEVFSIFDELVTKHNCEKISTLGDCYFCVSGCPEPAPDHADNCVEMGLAIIESLGELRRRTGLPIEMRVGIHTGSVFCGVMGTKRFKFDVWSRDVRIASHIESISKPGRVLISSSTKACLTNAHEFEETDCSRSVPELVGHQLQYVIERHAQEPALPVSEWKRRHSQSIDSILHPQEEDTGYESPFPAGSPVFTDYNTSTTLCCPWRKKRVTAPIRRSLAYSHSSSSIVDIFTKQKQLQKCTSYAELAVPQQDTEKSEIDEKIVELMEEQRVNFDTYFDPQLKIISLNFHDKDWEVTYRNYGRDLDDGSNGEMTETELGFRITKLSYMIDTLVLFACYLLIMIGSAVCLSGDRTFSNLWPAWLGIFLFGLIVELLIITHVFAVVAPNLFPKWFASFATKIINWYIRSIVALFMIYYPMTVVCVSIAQCQSSGIESVAGLAHIQMTFFVTLVVLISSISFMEVGHIIKLVGGFLSGFVSIVMVVAVHLRLCINEISLNETLTTEVTPMTQPTLEVNRPFEMQSPEAYLMTYYTRHVAPEAAILILLVLLLLAVVNRMSEVSVRLSFIGRIEASARRRYTRQRKAQSEWLLYNIIPPHVAYKLRTNGKFSQNHECVGVIFASIVNFREFQLDNQNSDEDSFRLLNTIISDFDALLDQPRFSSVQKIKTIGSTYMAASGLDLPLDHAITPDHLVELIDFAQQLIEVLEQVNRQRPGFVFRMRIGFNYGPITSGVVGSRKMLYDIWGDTVNVASRMDTTGHVNKIHMPEYCLSFLAPYVNCEQHKVINVKGKGEMRTLFVTRKYIQL